MDLLNAASTHASKLIRLPNGEWIDPKDVSRIVSHPLARGNMDDTYPPRVTVFFNRGDYIGIDLSLDADSQKWADEFAERVNEFRD
jgi:hypothetical protein